MMNDSVKKPDDKKDDADANSGTDGNASDNIKPAETPVANATTNAATGNQGASQQGEGMQRSLGEESKEVSQEKKPELDLEGKLNEIKNRLAAYSQLKPETMLEAINGLAGKAMANLAITAQDIDGMVQKVDPFAHAAKHAQDAMKGVQLAMQPVAETALSYLASPVVNMAKADVGISVTRNT